MANRYWITDDSGNFNSSTNWSTTSGGTGGASVPGTGDTAIFDSNSFPTHTGIPNITISSVSVQCKISASVPIGITINNGGELTLEDNLYSLNYLEVEYGTLNTNGLDIKVSNWCEFRGTSTINLSTTNIILGENRTSQTSYLCEEHVSIDADGARISLYMPSASIDDCYLQDWGNHLYGAIELHLSDTDDAVWLAGLIKADEFDIMGDGKVRGNFDYDWFADTLTVTGLLDMEGDTAGGLSLNTSPTVGNSDIGGGVFPIVAGSEVTVFISNTTLSNISASGGATFNALTSDGNVDGGGNSGWSFEALPDVRESLTIVDSVSSNLSAHNTIRELLAATEDVGNSTGDNYTKLLLHFDGTNESTTFTDSSSSGHTVTPHGDTKISTAQSKFGGASGLFDGNGDYLDIPASSDWDLAKDDFTIDFWYYPLAFSSYRGLVGFGGSSDASDWRFTLYHVNDGILRCGIAAGQGDLVAASDLPVAANQWNHVALVRKGTGSTDLNIYVNGIASASPGSGNVTLNSWGQGLTIGRLYLDYPGYMINGYIDEFRFSKGIARWISNFTPPISAYNNMAWNYSYTSIIGDCLNASDVISPSKIFTNLISDGFSISDATALLFTAVLNESLNIIDSTSDKRLLFNTLTDYLMIYDQMKTAWKATISDRLTLTDHISQVLGIVVDDWLTMNDQIRSNWNGREIIKDTLNLWDLAIGYKKYANTVSDSLGITDKASYKLTIAVLEYLGFKDLANGMINLSQTVRDSLLLKDYPAHGFNAVISEVLHLVDTNSVIATFINSVVETLNLTDLSTLKKNIPVTVSDVLSFSENVTSKGCFYSVVYDTIAMNCEVEVSGEIWQCYVLNTPDFLPSMYSGFAFNSYCTFDNRSFGANDTGIYELTGDTDNGNEIHTGVIMPQTDFGSPNQKRFRRGYLGISGDNPVMVFQTEGGERQAYDIDTNGHVVASSELKSKKWTLSIADFDQLDHVKLLPIILTK